MGKKTQPLKLSAKPEKMLLGCATGAVLRRYGPIVLISGWMFILGVLVGRETAPIKFDIEKIHHELAALKKTVDQKQQNRFKIIPEDMSGKNELEFYEALKVTDDAESVEMPVDSGAVHIGAIPHKTAVLKKSEKRAEISKLVLAAEVDKPVISPEKESRKGEYVIQVASMKDGSMCDALVSSLRKKGYPACRTEGNIPGKGIWFRVRIGSFKTRDEAAQTMQRLKNEKFKPMLIRNRNAS
ncbi:MAG: SPOR domain-containing protein [Desulfobacterales bacterium]|nr:SPOR domain-containing protein [Desulfobacterales bacterium]MDD4073549.1 SPOR domain-containing protein [Desulfobacterales bacterium]MDD4392853.1 SPOR domain-containing protein [Desulfobacterales bacterium]